MNDAMRYQQLIDTIGRKNTLDGPVVAPVSLEVRTMIGFVLKQDDQVKMLLDDRVGATAFRVIWEYKISPDLLNDFTFGLVDGEKALFDGTMNAAIRYLGTYVIQKRKRDVPRYVTTWGCTSKEDAEKVAKGPWNGPQGLEAKFEQVFSSDFFDRAKARVTTYGLAAAVVF